MNTSRPPDLLLMTCVCSVCLVQCESFTQRYSEQLQRILGKEAEALDVCEVRTWKLLYLTQYLTSCNGFTDHRRALKNKKKTLSLLLLINNKTYNVILRSKSVAKTFTILYILFYSLFKDYISFILAFVVILYFYMFYLCLFCLSVRLKQKLFALGSIKFSDSN